MYEIAIHLSVSDLQAYVNTKIKDGFRPEGGITIIPEYDISKDGRFEAMYGMQRSAGAPTRFTAYAQVIIKI
ncbi:hypothetical protein [Gluconobacter wancherniae]|uniref:hypothetical protein n=1 Tax=Gluconobacter wancherniae TaxID=1307955 RepID=UPI001B8AA58F|nr:hypothetical protein [Gluconobacter wancherniae]MBS1088129.1 hypothetical protein [Gluconobacter wancherniae]